MHPHLALTDNTVTENAVVNGKSKDPLVNAEWKMIQSRLLDKQYTITAKRVISADNAADA